MEHKKLNEPESPALNKTDVRRSFFVQWAENVKSEVSEDLINRMSVEDFSLFIKCRLPEKYLITMRNTLLFIGDDKRMILLSHIKICRSLGRI